MPNAPSRVGQHLNPTPFTPIEQKPEQTLDQPCSFNCSGTLDYPKVSQISLHFCSSFLGICLVLTISSVLRAESNKETFFNFQTWLESDSDDDGDLHTVNGGEGATTSY
ncbi:hypothetical protein Nepgr_026772 [Nepenthes gracilis]|uniref:Uncharacterized protein n=1 Tax=Nepenthes gracilis TaxID=150966 RepID=A0AAD3Y2F0_NEPGR|nr:hypothetical protein Nepgr_026772 [Nepenthes gracilis]